MKYELIIFTKGGLVLWQSEGTPAAPVHALIHNVLLEERGGKDTSTTIDNYSLKWLFANEANLVFVIVYPKILQPGHLDKLLETMKSIFLQDYHDSTGLDRDYSPLDQKYREVSLHLEKAHAAKRQNKVPRTFEQTKKFENTKKGSSLTTKEKAEAARAAEEDEITRNIKAMKLPPGPRRKGKGSTKSTSGGSPTASQDAGKKKRQHEARVWDDQISKEGAAALDYSSKTDGDGAVDVSVIEAQFVDKSKLGSKNTKGIYEVQDVTVPDRDDDDDDEDAFDIIDSNTLPAPKQGGMFSYLKSFTSQRELTAETLQPVLATMREHLIQKNVAGPIADDLCESVGLSLRGKKLGTFDRVSTVVRESMEKALTKILTPKTSLDILRDIDVAKGEKRPYVITFIGVNGVGKSTNLSKVCFWLLQNNYKILIAACDTFRSGAVEQLRVHARNLGALETGGSIELFERGYGKDAAGIAKDAIQYAKSNQFDVVLVDTAGRMQDNEPLMRALAKLVAVNNPDKVIFVGEALVGNEAVDQLTKFNQALKDFSGQQNPRHIDGMILTKFDTIDDKVGAALSMTHVTGQPIYFVGTGQTYTDLKSLKVSHIVRCLLRQ